MEELWKPSPSVDGLEVSSLGRIRVTPHQKEMPHGGLRWYGGHAWHGNIARDASRPRPAIMEATMEAKAETMEAGNSEDTEAAQASDDQPEPEQEPELKGGPLARRAAIACGEKSFWIFIKVKDAEEAKAEVCRRCGVESRRLIDHDDVAAKIWNTIDTKYRLWLDGHNVSLD